MKIQLIRHDYQEIAIIKTIHKSTIKEPKSLDEFDINIIDLRSKKLWQSKTFRNSINEIFKVDATPDLQDIYNMVLNSKKSTTIVLIPKNIDVSYNYNSSKFHKLMNLKHCYGAIENILRTLLDVPTNINFENTTTNINDQSYNAAFYFNIQANSKAILSLSESSNKPTTLKMGERLILTTLDIKLGDELHLNTFLEKCKLITDVEEYPEWLHAYHILDDELQQQRVEEQYAVIEQAKNIINIAEDKLKSNLDYKSILFVNEKTLENRVRCILEKILDIDLSTFIDEGKEDFLVEVKDGLEFIGEIKGVTANIRSENIAQLEHHYRSRLDKLSDEGADKNVKALLIMNHSRTKPIGERQPIHDEQINLAIRNQSLIIETTTLLYIYEKFINQDLKPERCVDLFYENKGLLTKSQIDDYCG